MTQSYGSNDLGPVEKRPLVKYCFRNFTDDTSVLISGKDTLSSSISFDPVNVPALPDTGEQAYCLEKIGGMDYVITGSKATVLSDRYSIYTVRDITDVYVSISQLVWRFCAISAFCITAGIIRIVLLMLYAAKPLKELSSEGRTILMASHNAMDIDDLCNTVCEMDAGILKSFR